MNLFNGPWIWGVNKPYPNIRSTTRAPFDVGRGRVTWNVWVLVGDAVPEAPNPPRSNPSKWLRRISPAEKYEELPDQREPSSRQLRSCCQPCVFYGIFQKTWSWKLDDILFISSTDVRSRNSQSPTAVLRCLFCFQGILPTQLNRRQRAQCNPLAQSTCGSRLSIMNEIPYNLNSSFGIAHSTWTPQKP